MSETIILEGSAAPLTIEILPATPVVEVFSLVPIGPRGNPGIEGPPGIPDDPIDGFTYGRQDGSWVQVVPITGGTMMGPLMLNNVAPAQYATLPPETAAHKAYVDAMIGAGAGGGDFLPTTGGTMTGDIAMSIGSNLTSTSPAGVPAPLIIRAASAADPTSDDGGAAVLMGGLGYYGGDVAITAGPGNRGGHLMLEGGAASEGNAGDVYLDGGKVKSTTGAYFGGNVALKGGGDGGPSLLSVGGDVTLVGGIGNERSGGVAIQGGASGTLSGKGLPGDVVIQGGANSATTAPAGKVIITGGVYNASDSLVGAVCGDVQISGGSIGVGASTGADKIAGNLILAPGTNGVDPTKNGSIFIRSLPTVAQVDPNALWNNAGALNLGAGAEAGGDGGDALPATGGTMTGNLVMGLGTTILTEDMTAVGARTLNIRAGSNSAGAGSAVAVKGGAGQFGGGGVELTGGDAIHGGDGAGGWILLSGGAGDPTYSNVRGKIRFANLPTMGQTTADAIWNNAGVINIGLGGIAAQEALEARLASIEARLTAAGF